MYTPLLSQLEPLAALAGQRTATATLEARVLVMSKLIDTMLLHLSLSQRRDVERSFRREADAWGTAGDKRHPPCEFEATLLEHANDFLNTLKQEW
jgi:hypothetical protein